MSFCVLFIANCTILFLLLLGLFERRLATGHARKFSFDANLVLVCTEVKKNYLLNHGLSADLCHA